MVQKYQSPIRIYKYPFELVMAAYERRFPTCELIPVLVATEIIAEEKSKDGAIHVIERRCKLNIDAPYLLKKIAGVDYVYFIQRNTLDRRQRELKIEAWNESFQSRIVINEYCRYYVHQENPDWTCFEQSASLQVKSFFGFEKAVEKLAAKQYAQNIKNAKEIVEIYIQKLKEEGIEYVPPFEPTTTLTNDAPNENHCTSVDKDSHTSEGKDSHTTSEDKDSSEDKDRNSSKEESPSMS